MALPLSLFLFIFNALSTIALPSSGGQELSASPPSSLQRRDLTPYAPKKVDCPATPLTRPANGISPAESSYASSRYTAASSSLQSWLDKTNSGFGKPDKYPTLAMATSGGGFRALLTGAGVHQAFDSRDGNASVSGLYQALTYESGLSGGAWLLGSITGNNWPTITSLKTSLWEQSFQIGLSLTGPGPVDDAELGVAVTSKGAAGFPPTIVDIYGRELGYALLEQAQGGIGDTYSGVARQSGFTSSSVPFPIMLAVATNGTGGQCYPDDNAPIFELTPYEFGSWDSGYAEFASMEYIGSRNNSCVTGYDNLGYIMGSSSDVFDGVCLAIPSAVTAELQNITNIAENIFHVPMTADERAVFAPYPNPFASQPTELDLVDGGESNQNIPIWPFLHRSIDVLFITDASSDTDDNYPNGTAIHQTYLQAQANGLTRMPSIPDPGTFVAEGLNRRPAFFGCDDNSVTTIVYLPNHNYTYNSGQDTFKTQYSKSETDAMINNGNAVGSFNGNQTWGVCVGCAIMKKTGTQLPDPCAGCFDSFCAS